MIRHLLFAAVLLIAPAFAHPAFAAEQPYLTPTQVDLVRLLPPPPADDGPDLAIVLTAQATRTPQRAAQAVADTQESVFDMFRPVLGEQFGPDAAPLATRVFDRLGETEDVLTGPVKKLYERKRPFLVSPDVHPAVALSRSGSYPSGHATLVTINGIVLAAMLPEQRTVIFARMADYAQSRVIGGVHFPSDVEAGQRSGTAAAAVLFDDPDFKNDFATAKQQLRTAMGLPN